MVEPVQLALGGVNAWVPPTAGSVEEKFREERLRVLADLDDNLLVKIEQKVARLLRDFPETRESDTALAIEYWRTYQPAVLAEWKPLDLEALYDLDQFDSISRTRRHVQNDLSLFQATLRTRRARGDAQLEFASSMYRHPWNVPSKSLNTPITPSTVAGRPSR